jgi:hypothetical protein
MRAAACPAYCFYCNEVKFIRVKKMLQILLSTVLIAGKTGA